MCIQALAAELAVERLDECVVGGLAWSGKVECNVTLIGPEIEIARHELAALVDPDCLREANLAANPFKHLDNISTEIEAHFSRR